MAPTVVGAVTRTCEPEAVSEYDSSSSSDGTFGLAADARMTNVAASISVAKARDIVRPVRFSSLRITRSAAAYSRGSTAPVTAIVVVVEMGTRPGVNAIEAGTGMRECACGALNDGNDGNDASAKSVV